MEDARYDVLTWDICLQEFTVQEGLESQSEGVGIWGVRAALRELRSEFGYPCHRTADRDSDAFVLVERIK